MKSLIRKHCQTHLLKETIETEEQENSFSLLIFETTPMIHTLCVSCKKSFSIEMEIWQQLKNKYPGEPFIPYTFKH